MTIIDAWQFLWLVLLSVAILLAYVSKADERWDLFRPRYMGSRSALPQKRTIRRGRRPR